MKWINNLLLLIGALIGFTVSSCSTGNEYTTSPQENYDALWRILDEGYCYFDLKLPQDSTWFDMYKKHLPKIKPRMTSDSLLLAMDNLLAELRDGHVNVSTAFDFSHYWVWDEVKHPSSLNIYARDRYLGNRPLMAAGLTYDMIKYRGHEADSIGLIVYSSFSSPIGNGNINAALSRLRDSRALIIDIRGNGGGSLTYSDLLASHFTRDEITSGYIRYKTGPEHDAFSDPTPLILSPTKGLVWLRPVVLLTDRAVYSAANDFAMKMKSLPFVTLMGDSTGGGAGLPVSRELPNGWGVRYSASRITDSEDQDTELGLAPHYLRTPLPDPTMYTDPLIEEAISYIQERYRAFAASGQWEK